MMDNNTAVHYVNKSGGSTSEGLCRISSEIVAWCEPQGISINAVYLPGAQNVIADRVSRVVAWCEPQAISINAVYLPGAQNVIADRGSRAPPPRIQATGNSIRQYSNS